MTIRVGRFVVANITSQWQASDLITPEVLGPMIVGSPTDSATTRRNGPVHDRHVRIMVYAMVEECTKLWYSTFL